MLLTCNVDDDVFTAVFIGSVLRRYKGHEGHVLSLYPHRDSQKFVSGGQDKKALMWDTRMSVPVQTYQTVGGAGGYFRALFSK